MDASDQAFLDSVCQFLLDDSTPPEPRLDPVTFRQRSRHRRGQIEPKLRRYPRRPRLRRRTLQAGVRRRPWGKVRGGDQGSGEERGPSGLAGDRCARRREEAAMALRTRAGATAHCGRLSRSAMLNFPLRIGEIEAEPEISPESSPRKRRKSTEVKESGLDRRNRPEVFSARAGQLLVS
ncbi:uncharacterized protein A4U43_C10F6980 [Asparagus officinalis]|uniref:Uncharacterized protein n=1 Tax=Asparagus officinalis TaxID=4686 RepID=A0A5P1E4C5_ASPOF|nr:uncharacterized protein A4U43_C10F6980 [Asparagus officinalis]